VTVQVDVSERFVVADSSIGDPLARLNWSAHSVLAAGERYVGVRSNSADADSLLRRAFAGHVVDSVAAPACFYSLIVGSTVASRSGVEHLNVVFRVGVTVARTRSVLRALQALGAYVSNHADVGPAPGLTRFAGIALVGDRPGVLLPLEALRLVGQPGFERSVERLGLRIADGVYVDVDPGTAEAVVSPPALSVEASVPDDLASIDPPGTFPGVQPGRYRLGDWAVRHPGGGADTPSRAALVGCGIRVLLNPDLEDPQATLERVTAVASACEPLAFCYSQRDLVSRLASLPRS